MARNGAGTYTLPAGNPVVTGTTISSTTHNNTMNDIATAITGSIAADGQTPITSNLPMNNFRHTGVGNATAQGQYASVQQVQDCSFNCLTSVAGTDAITAIASITPSAYATGQRFSFVASGTNTGAATLNVNSLGAKDIVRIDGTALQGGDIVSSQPTCVEYITDKFYLLSQNIQVLGGVKRDFSNVSATAGGTANGITATVAPTVTALGGIYFIRAAAANTGATTLQINSTAQKSVYKGNNIALSGGEIAGAGFGCEFRYDATLDKYELMNPYITSSSETAAGIIEIATSAESSAGTDTVRAITPSGLRSGLNASGSAPIYASRAWVNFNGTGTPAIRASGNVSSITDNGTGDYTINFTIQMPNADYATIVSGSWWTTFGVESTANTTTASVRIRLNNPNTAAALDRAEVSAAIFC